MKKRDIKILALIIGLVFLFCLFPSSSATVVWSDDFSDGDHNGWTITMGNWAVTDQRLEAIAPNGQRIWHSSTQVTGTWSFDYYHTSSISTGGCHVLFMAVSR